MRGARTLLGEDADLLADADFRVLLATNVLGTLGTALISPLLDSLTGPFGVGPTVIGQMVSVFIAPTIVAIPLAGVLSDRYGRKPILVAGLVLFGAGGLAIPLTTDFRLVLAFRAVQGLGYAGMIPIIVTSIGDLYAGTRETAAQGLRFTSSGLAQAAFPLLAGWLVVFAWQYPFLLYGLALPVAAAVAIVFEEPTGHRNQDPGGAEPGVAAEDDTVGGAVDGGTDGSAVDGATGGSAPEADADGSGADDDTDGSAADDGTDGTARAAAGGSSLRALLGLARQRRVAAVMAARIVPELLWIAFLTFSSIFVVRLLGGTPGQAGATVTIASLVYAATASQVGRIVAAVGGRFLPLVGANLCLGGGFALLAAAPSVPVTWVAAAAFGVGFGVSLTLYRSLITGYAPEQLRGGLVSLSETLGRISATLIPVVMSAAIAALDPALGFDAAVRTTGVAVGVLAGAVGLGSVIVANGSAPVEPA